MELCSGNLWPRRANDSRLLDDLCYRGHRGGDPSPVVHGNELSMNPKPQRNLVCRNPDCCNSGAPQFDACEFCPYCGGRLVVRNLIVESEFDRLAAGSNVMAETVAELDADNSSTSNPISAVSALEIKP